MTNPKEQPSPPPASIDKAERDRLEADFQRTWSNYQTCKNQQEEIIRAWRANPVTYENSPGGLPPEYWEADKKTREAYNLHEEAEKRIKAVAPPSGRISYTKRRENLGGVPLDDLKEQVRWDLEQK